VRELSRSNSELRNRQIVLKGTWTQAESDRILAVLRRIESLSGQTVSAVFNHQDTLFVKSGRPGRVGRTRGSEVELDADWTDWTLAHELGHRWNNAWQRRPEQDLRTSLGAGRWEWLKRPLRRFEKGLERLLKKWGFKKRLDWRALWYHPGQAAPPCGSDRNFNSSEDLAESFAASVFPELAKKRAAKASQRLARTDWDWGTNERTFSQTKRGQTIQSRMKAVSMIDPPDQNVA
jgi:hypothetical protein